MQVTLARGILGRPLAQQHIVTSAATKGHPVERALRHPGGSSDVGCPLGPQTPPHSLRQPRGCPYMANVASVAVTGPSA